jgi:hypothetical protein
MMVFDQMLDWSDPTRRTMKKISCRQWGFRKRTYDTDKWANNKNKKEEASHSA